MKVTELKEGDRILITKPYELNDYMKEIYNHDPNKYPNHMGMIGTVLNVYEGRIGNDPQMCIKFDNSMWDGTLIPYSWLEGCFEKL